jgi:hypothetical protein
MHQLDNRDGTDGDHISIICTTKSDCFCRSFAPDSSIEVRVGTGNAARQFTIRKEMLCGSSEYFNGRCRSSGETCIRLGEDDPVAFDMFVHWLLQKEEPISYKPNSYSEEPWRSKSATAWLLARKLRAAQFKRFALSQFVQNCALSDLSTWVCIEKEAVSKSPLRRFSEHWIAWNFHLAAGGPSELADLEAAQRANLVTQTTRDPRIYDLEHWYSDCGDNLNPSCSHDPDIRAAALRAAKRVKTPLPEIGRDWETRRTGNPNNGSTSSLQLTTSSSGRGSQPSPTTSSSCTSPPVSMHTNSPVQQTTYAPLLDDGDALSIGWTIVLGVSAVDLERSSIANNQRLSLQPR